MLLRKTEKQFMYKLVVCGYTEILIPLIQDIYVIESVPILKYIGYDMMDRWSTVPKWKWFVSVFQLSFWESNLKWIIYSGLQRHIYKIDNNIISIKHPSCIISNQLSNVCLRHGLRSVLVSTNWNTTLLLRAIKANIKVPTQKTVQDAKRCWKPVCRVKSGSLVQATHFTESCLKSSGNK